MSDSAAKTFWQKPEGTTGKVVMGAGILGAGYALYHFLPFIITLLENTLYAGALAGAVVGLGLLVSNGRVRTLVRYGFQSIMRGITSFFIAVDPIGILKNFVHDLKETLLKMQEQMALLKGQIKTLTGKINERKTLLQENFERMRAAKQLGKNFTLFANQIARLEPAIKELEELRGKLEVAEKMVGRLHEISNITAQDIENEVALREDQYKATRAAHGAFSQARAIISGNSDGREMYDEALDFLKESANNKMADIENFMSINEGMLASLDLDNLAATNAALAKMEEFEKNSSLFEKVEVRKQEVVQQDAVHSLYGR